MTGSAGTFRRCRPSARLSEFVDFFWMYDGFMPTHARERLLPTGTMELVFRVDDEGRLASGVAGPRSEFLVLDTSRPFSIIGAHFRPGGGFPFFGVPSNELHNRDADLDAVWGGSAASLRDRLWDTKKPDERFHVLDEALLDRASGRLTRHAGVRHALRVFDHSRGTCPVAVVVDQIGISQRRFVDLFQSEVGLSPKTFCRIRRFNEALARIERMTDVDWLDVALSCGYFDQAHFNHDFHAFSGINPSAYLRNRASRMHVAVPD